MNKDARLPHMVEHLKKTDYVKLVYYQEELEKCLNEGQYTHLLLPITGVDNMLVIRGSNMQLEEKWLHLLKGKTILTGLVHEGLKEACKRHAIDVKSYMTEAFAIANNYITCEGIIEKLVQLNDKSIYGSTVLIVGFGKLGQILCKVLAPLQVHLIVASRDAKDHVKVKIDGYESIDYGSIEDVVNRIDTMITTVPARVVDERVLQKLVHTDTLVIDVSSDPYTFDLEGAQSIGVFAHRLPQIPGRIAPRSSGVLLAESIRSC